MRNTVRKDSIAAIYRVRSGSTSTCTTSDKEETRCNTLQHATTHCNTLQCAAIYCSILQHTCATSDKDETGTCNSVSADSFRTTQHKVQHTATRCNTLQHTCTTSDKEETRARATARQQTRFEPRNTKCNTHCNTLQHAATHLHDERQGGDGHEQQRISRLIS